MVVNMVCTTCRQPRGHVDLIKTFVGSIKRHDNQGKLVTCHVLCRRCVVGKVLPVWRPSIERWHFGEVTAFDTHSGKHHMLFPDETKDCVIIEQTPYEDYLAHYRGRPRPRASRQPAKDDLEPIPLLSLQRRPHDVSDFRDREENERLMQRALRRLAANQDDDEDDNMDWSLNRVAQASVVSPVRNPTPKNAPQPANGEFITLNDNLRGSPWHGMAPRTHEQLLNRTVSNGGYPSRAPVIPIPAPVAFGSRNKGNGHHLPKPSPRMWSVEEDKELIKTVEAAMEPIKWTAVAASIEGRTGKQCRERFLNHLKPKLRKEDWSAPEDALLFHLYTVLGPRWALMRKALHGRTDNRIKNRFHFMRRRIDKDTEKHITGNNKRKAETGTNDSNATKSPETQELETKIRNLIPHVASETFNKPVDSPYKFGPFLAAEGQVCKRCSLVAPSIQTGRVVCESTGWCEACTRLPPYVCGDNILKCLNLRKDESAQKSATSGGNAKKE